MVAKTTRELTADTSPAPTRVIPTWEPTGVAEPLKSTIAQLMVEAGAAIKTAYEGEADTNAFTDDEKTKLTNIEALADVTDATNVEAAGALMDSEVSADLKTFALPANTTISAFGATVVDDADAEAARTTLGAAISTIGQGQQHFFIPAGSMLSRATSGATAGTAELATNDVMLDYMAFDAVADEHAQFMVQMPKRWNEGTIVAQFIWSHPETTTDFGVAFFLQAVAFANDDAMDAAFGAAVGVTDTGGTTDDAYITAETAAITVAGTPGDEEYVIFQVYRDVSDAADTMAVDARLLGVKIHWTSNSATDD